MKGEKWWGDKWCKRVTTSEFRVPKTEEFTKSFTGQNHMTYE